MSTTEVGRLPAIGKPDGTNRDGVSLQAVIESDRRLDELSCARLVGNLAEAVHTAQKAGQPLGTVTPASIVVQPDGGVKLMTGTTSLRYSAPETLRGGAGDRRTDVFALGIVLWEVLAHERLFDGSDDDAIKQAVLERAIRPPSELNANVPAELDAICKRALARDPADRYQSAHVMAAEIDAVLGDAGYPESNAQIATSLARAFAPAPEPASAQKPSSLPAVQPGTKTVPLPSVVPGSAEASSPSPPPAPTSRSGVTLPPPALKPAPSSPAGPASSTGSGPIAAPRPVPAPGSGPLSAPTSPPVAPVVPTSSSPATAPGPATGSPPLGPVVPAGNAPGGRAGSATRQASSAPVAPTSQSPGGVGKAPPLAPEAAAASPPASAPGSVTRSAIGEAAPRGTPLATMPAFSPPRAPAQTIMGSHGAPRAPTPSETAPFGSQAVSSGAPGPHPAPPPGRMEAPPMPAQIAVETRLPAPFKPRAHPQPPRTIANAETLATPQVPAQLGLPPGITVQPSSPPATVQPTDDTGAFGAEHHADPAEVIALHQADANASGTREGRDVLAGWGWSTGSLQALEDDDAEDALRRSRKHLLFAIGGALFVVMIIVIVAFAFSGSKKPAQDDRGAVARPSPTAPSVPATAPETPKAASPAQPPSQPPEPARAEPPAPPPPTPANAEPTPQPAAVEPPGPGAVVPPRFDSVKPEPAPAAPAKAEPPRAEPRKAEPKAEPPKAEPARVTIAPKAPARAEPQRPEPANAVEKKPPEPKRPPDKVAKRPAPDRIAKPTSRAQPLDPYAAPLEPRRADPAAAYRTGLQQYAHGDTAGALATFRGSLLNNPGFAPTWRGIGLVYEKMGNKGQARAAFKRYLQLAPSAGDADQIRDRMERLGS